LGNESIAAALNTQNEIPTVENTAVATATQHVNEQRSTSKNETHNEVGLR
jgi:hypothetical protein